MTKQMATEFTFMPMVPDMKENGLMTNSMDVEKKHGKMEVNITDTIFNQRKMEKACINGSMAILILVIGKTTKSTDMVFTFGLMEEVTAANGQTI